MLPAADKPSCMFHASFKERGVLTSHLETFQPPECATKAKWPKTRVPLLILKDLSETFHRTIGKEDQRASSMGITPFDQPRLPWPPGGGNAVHIELGRDIMPLDGLQD